jgi:hypothetical protein
MIQRKRKEPEPTDETTNDQPVLKKKKSKKSKKENSFPEISTESQDQTANVEPVVETVFRKKKRSGFLRYLTFLDEIVENWYIQPF